MTEKTIKKANNKPNYINILEYLKEDNEKIKNTLEDFKFCVKNIEIHTENMSSTLKDFREDNRKYIELIAGKRQVPISIFSLVVFLLITLLVASEVRYSNIDIRLTPNRGFEITPHKQK